MSKKLVLFTFLLLLSSSYCIDFDALIKKLKSYLQNNVDNDVFLDFMEPLRKGYKKTFLDHFAKNKKAFPNHSQTIKRNKRFIEEQGNYGDIINGLMSFSGNGCELIAIYNALYELTKQESINLPEIIDMHEKDGIILQGLFWTSPKAIEEYFIKNGFKTQSSSKKVNYENIDNWSDLILTIYNNIDDITDQVHTIYITKKLGKYYVHNNGTNSAYVAYDSISDVLSKINGWRAKDIFLIGINKK